MEIPHEIKKVMRLSVLYETILWMVSALWQWTEVQTKEIIFSVKAKISRIRNEIIRNQLGIEKIIGQSDLVVCGWWVGTVRRIYGT